MGVARETNTDEGEEEDKGNELASNSSQTTRPNPGKIRKAITSPQKTTTENDPVADSWSLSLLVVIVMMSMIYEKRQRAAQICAEVRQGVSGLEPGLDQDTSLGDEQTAFAFDAFDGVEDHHIEHCHVQSKLSRPKQKSKLSLQRRIDVSRSRTVRVRQPKRLRLTPGNADPKSQKRTDRVDGTVCPGVDDMSL